MSGYVGQNVLCEVFKDGQVVTFEPSIYDENDAMIFLNRDMAPNEDRHFFLATLTLSPAREEA